MAKIFLDTNIIIDLIEKRSKIIDDDLQGHVVFISPLSVHILMFFTKKKIPYSLLSKLREQFLIIAFDKFIMDKSLAGPTNDFEDNVQLHSAANAECDLFLTQDKILLGMKFFGKTQITKDITSFIKSS